MIIGPIFTRELVLAPRRTRFYVGRAVYVSMLLLLMCTAWQILAGNQVVRNVGDLARFGATLFQIFAPLQLGLAIFFSALLAASAVAQEKDRGTLILLLLTHLTNSELVLGKLLASMLSVGVLLAASVPVLMLNALFGGTSFEQIGRSVAVAAAAALAAGSIGSTLALWREKTFQTLALTLLALVFWLAIGEVIGRGALGASWAGIDAADWAAGLTPWRAILAASQPAWSSHAAIPLVGDAVNLFLVTALAISAVTCGLGIVMVRVWNPSREARANTAADESAESIFDRQADTAQSVADLGAAAAAPEVGRSQQSAPSATTAAYAHPSTHAAPGRVRQPWDNPILWREVCTWAYGRKVLIIRLIYLLLVAACAVSLYQMAHSEAGITRASGAVALVPLLLVSLILVNAQAVTSLTTERDARALDLLLVTDLTAKEFVFGKLAGVFYNMKEMVLLPLLLCVYAWWNGAMIGENLLYLLVGLLSMYAFVAMLGVHSGLSYDNSRSAIAVSLGTLFFLFVGVAVCMRMMIAFSGSFSGQFGPFLACICGGSMGLYFALGARNRSQAIGWASLLLPFFTFYALTSFLLQSMLAGFLATLFVYSFTTAAMLMPDISEFDVATGRTSSADE